MIRERSPCGNPSRRSAGRNPMDQWPSWWRRRSPIPRQRAGRPPGRRRTAWPVPFPRAYSRRRRMYTTRCRSLRPFRRWPGFCRSRGCAPYSRRRDKSDHRRSVMAATSWIVAGDARAESMTIPRTRNPRPKSSSAFSASPSRAWVPSSDGSAPTTCLPPAGAASSRRSSASDRMERIASTEAGCGW